MAYKRSVHRIHLVLLFVPVMSIASSVQIDDFSADQLATNQTGGMDDLHEDYYPDETDSIPSRHIAPNALHRVCGETIQPRHPSHEDYSDQPIEPERFPWIAYLNVSTNDGDKRRYCTGTLISDQWIVTSARCLNGAIRVDIVLGETHLHNDIQHLNSREYYLHPRWGTNRETFTADLALIRLPISVAFSDSIAPACLPGFNESPHVNNRVIVTHWATQPHATDDGQLAFALRQTFGTVISTALCKRVYGDFVTNDVLCCSSDAQSNGTCPTADNDQGGGSMNVQQANGRWTVIGIASFSASVGGCHDYPEGFTRVNAYLNWIYVTAGIGRPLVVNTKPTSRPTGPQPPTTVTKKPFRHPICSLLKLLKPYVKPKEFKTTASKMLNRLRACVHSVSTVD